MGKFKPEFILHWIWTIVFGILTITGLALLGPKYGWVMNYNLAVADYLHRTMAVLFTVIFLVEIALEVRRILWLKGKREPWLVVGKNGFALLTFIASWLFIVTGIFLWYCMENEHGILALAAIVHEMLTFVMVFAIIWHIWDKSHVLILGGGRNKQPVKLE